MVADLVSSSKQSFQRQQDHSSLHKVTIILVMPESPSAVFTCVTVAQSSVSQPFGATAHHQTKMSQKAPGTEELARFVPNVPFFLSSDHYSC